MKVTLFPPRGQQFRSFAVAAQGGGDRLARGVAPCRGRTSAGDSADVYREGSSTPSPERWRARRRGKLNHEGHVMNP